MSELLNRCIQINRVILKIVTGVLCPRSACATWLLGLSLLFLGDITPASSMGAAPGGVYQQPSFFRQGYNNVRQRFAAMRQRAAANQARKAELNRQQAANRARVKQIVANQKQINQSKQAELKQNTNALIAAQAKEKQLQAQTLQQRQQEIKAQYTQNQPAPKGIVARYQQNRAVKRAIAGDNQYQALKAEQKNTATVHKTALNTATQAQKQALTTFKKDTAQEMQTLKALGKTKNPAAVENSLQAAEKQIAQHQSQLTTNQQAQGFKKLEGGKRQASSVMNIGRSIQSVGDKAYKWADKVKTGDIYVKPAYYGAINAANATKAIGRSVTWVGKHMRRSTEEKATPRDWDESSKLKLRYENRLRKMAAEEAAHKQALAKGETIGDKALITTKEQRDAKLTAQYQERLKHNQQKLDSFKQRLGNDGEVFTNYDRDRLAYHQQEINALKQAHAKELTKQQTGIRGAFNAVARKVGVDRDIRQTTNINQKFDTKIQRHQQEAERLQQLQTKAATDVKYQPKKPDPTPSVADALQVTKGRRDQEPLNQDLASEAALPKANRFQRVGKFFSKVGGHLDRTSREQGDDTRDQYRNTKLRKVSELTSGIPIVSPVVDVSGMAMRALGKNLQQYGDRRELQQQRKQAPLTMEQAAAQAKAQQEAKIARLERKRNEELAQLDRAPTSTFGRAREALQTNSKERRREEIERRYRGQLDNERATYDEMKTKHDALLAEKAKAKAMFTPQSQLGREDMGTVNTALQANRAQRDSVDSDIAALEQQRAAKLKENQQNYSALRAGFRNRSVNQEYDAQLAAKREEKSKLEAEGQRLTNLRNTDPENLEKLVAAKRGQVSAVDKELNELQTQRAQELALAKDNSSFLTAKYRENQINKRYDNIMKEKMEQKAQLLNEEKGLRQLHQQDDLVRQRAAARAAEQQNDPNYTPPKQYHSYAELRDAATQPGFGHTAFRRDDAPLGYQLNNAAALRENGKLDASRLPPHLHELADLDDPVKSAGVQNKYLQKKVDLEKQVQDYGAEVERLKQLRARKLNPENLMEKLDMQRPGQREKLDKKYTDQVIAAEKKLNAVRAEQEDVSSLFQNGSINADKLEAKLNRDAQMRGIYNPEPPSQPDATAESLKKAGNWRVQLGQGLQNAGDKVSTVSGLVGTSYLPYVASGATAVRLGGANLLRGAGRILENSGRQKLNAAANVPDARTPYQRIEEDISKLQSERQKLDQQRARAMTGIFGSDVGANIGSAVANKTPFRSYKERLQERQQIEAQMAALDAKIDSLAQERRTLAAPAIRAVSGQAGLPQSPPLVPPTSPPPAPPLTPPTSPPPAPPAPLQPPTSPQSNPGPLPDDSSAAAQFGDFAP